MKVRIRFNTKKFVEFCIDDMNVRLYSGLLTKDEAKKFLEEFTQYVEAIDDMMEDDK
jgi:hypothetical protein